jgi:senataxin
MRPCISKFPNEKFYDKLIIDGPNVKEYNCTYLPGSIFGAYSFIHVEGGSEEHTNHSFRNLVEDDVAADIVYKLAKGIPNISASRYQESFQVLLNLTSLSVIRVSSVKNSM